MIQANINDPVDISYTVLGYTLNFSYTPWDMQFYPNLSQALYAGELFVLNATTGSPVPLWTYAPSTADESYMPPESGWAPLLNQYDYTLLEAVRIDVTVFRALLAAGEFMQLYFFNVRHRCFCVSFFLHKTAQC
jgi:hypothetical protein